MPNRDDRSLSDLDSFTVLVKDVEALGDRLLRVEITLYGLCGMILVAVVGAWIKLSLK